MALASVAIRSARIYLNDLAGITWSDSILMPLLQEAHGELQQELDINNSSVIKIQTSPIVVPAGSTDLGSNQPTNIISPISMTEGVVGIDPNFMVSMIKVTFLPSVDPVQELGYWAWLGDVIKFVGATTDRQVVLRYEASIATPQTLNDPLGCIFAERFIGPRIAALAYASIGKNNDKIQEIASENLYKIIKNQVLNDQRPIRHRAFRSKKGYGIGPFSTPIGSANTGGGTAVQFIDTLTPPDGIRTTFNFSILPKFIVFNGLTQFLGTGYTLAVVGGFYQVTLIDSSGNVITPQIGDSIAEEIN
jgi:hypothetical protein